MWLLTSLLGLLRYGRHGPAGLLVNLNAMRTPVTFKYGTHLEVGPIIEVEGYFTILRPPTLTLCGRWGT